MLHLFWHVFVCVCARVPVISPLQEEQKNQSEKRWEACMFQHWSKLFYTQFALKDYTPSNFKDVLAFDPKTNPPTQTPRSPVPSRPRGPDRLGGGCSRGTWASIPSPMATSCGSPTRRVGRGMEVRGRAQKHGWLDVVFFCGIGDWRCSQTCGLWAWVDYIVLYDIRFYAHIFRVPSI